MLPCCAIGNTVAQTNTLTCCCLQISSSAGDESGAAKVNVFENFKTLITTTRFVIFLRKNRTARIEKTTGNVFLSNLTYVLYFYLHMDESLNGIIHSLTQHA